MLERIIKNYYFSGTGNTKNLVEHFSAYLNSKGYDSVIREMEKGYDEDNEEDFTLGLVFPVAVQSTFPLVWDFILDLPDGRGRGVFMFDTMEAFSGGIVGPLRHTLRKKGYRCLGAKEFAMASSLNTDPKKVAGGAEKNRKAQADVIGYADDLISGRAVWRRIPLFSDLMRSISRPRSLWDKMSSDLSVERGCIKCMKCLRNCPVKAISMGEAGISLNHTLCNSCMRCASRCPTGAIKYKGKDLQLPPA